MSESESADDEITEHPKTPIKRDIIARLEKNEILTTTAFNSSNIKEVGDIMVESFWYWNSYTSYLQALIGVIVVLSLMTFTFHKNEVFVAMMGTVSSLIEALVGIPQFILNYRKKNVEGLAPMLIMMWLFGDFYKLTYYYSFNSPL